MTKPLVSTTTEGPVPFWWAATSVSLVLFAMAYWMWTVPLAPVAGLNEPIEAGDVSDDDILALAADSATVKMGRDTYSQNCVQCHGKRAEGFNGPNLTDNFWIKGGRPGENYRTIVFGRAGLMPPWGRVLGLEECKALAAYLETLRGTNEKGKPPQGTEVFLTKDEDTP